MLQLKRCLSTFLVVSMFFLAACAGREHTEPSSYELNYFDIDAQGAEPLYYDAVVVGAGVAGISAAVSIAEAGDSVVIFDKMPFIGGNSFYSEGTLNAVDPVRQAEQGIEALRQHVDSLIVIPNERLKFVSEQKITLANAFEVADDVLRQGVQSVSELINATAMINLDFADVTTVMSDAGYAHMGVGHASGREKAEQAAMAAINSPLIETKIDNATGVIISITASNDIGLDEI